MLIQAGVEVEWWATKTRCPPYNGIIYFLDMPNLSIFVVLDNERSDFLKHQLIVHFI